jgi:hypothetical protein
MATSPWFLRYRGKHMRQLLWWDRGGPRLEYPGARPAAAPHACKEAPTVSWACEWEHREVERVVPAVPVPVRILVVSLQLPLRSSAPQLGSWESHQQTNANEKSSAPPNAAQACRTCNCDNRSAMDNACEPAPIKIRSGAGR